MPKRLVARAMHSCNREAVHGARPSQGAGSPYIHFTRKRATHSVVQPIRRSDRAQCADETTALPHYGIDSLFSQQNKSFFGSHDPPDASKTAAPSREQPCTALGPLSPCELRHGRAGEEQQFVRNVIHVPLSASARA